MSTEIEVKEQPQWVLTERQKWALYQLTSGVKDKKLMQQTLGGFAGTGKTTIIKYLVKFLPNFAVAAYTGKAANVLRKKSIPASTIHSRIYKPYFDNGTVYWDLNPDPECEGFIIDEASMVSSDIYEDLKAFEMPMIFVGDHGQLEPIDSNFNLMEKPDYTLEEIHRNAGDIPRFAEHLRNGFASRGFKCEDGSVEFVYDRKVPIELLLEVDQIICAFNATRVEINQRVREAKGYTDILHVGERVMCLRNNRKAGLFNGMQGTVMGLSQGRYGRKFMDFQFDDILMEGIPYDVSCFGQEKYKIKHGDSPNPFDYAPCITCHKAQGDEFQKLLVIAQKCNKWDMKRWDYTAASRPKSKLYWKSA
jgi:exodeoxyribonuclease-5